MREKRLTPLTSNQRFRHLHTSVLVCAAVLGKEIRSVCVCACNVSHSCARTHRKYFGMQYCRHLFMCAEHLKRFDGNNFCANSICHALLTARSLLLRVRARAFALYSPFCPNDLHRNEFNSLQLNRFAKQKQTKMIVATALTTSLLPQRENKTVCAEHVLLFIERKIR